MSRSAIARRRRSSGMKYATIISASTITDRHRAREPGLVEVVTDLGRLGQPGDELVEVVAGNHGRVGRAQLLGELRLALEADAERCSASWERANILPATLNTDVFAPKGKVSAIPGRTGTASTVWPRQLIGRAAPRPGARSSKAARDRGRW